MVKYYTDLNEMDKETQVATIKSQVHFINTSLWYYEAGYQHDFETNNWHQRQKEFKEFIDDYKDFLRSESRNLSWSNFKELQLDKIIDSLTMVYIEVENGVYRPLEIINGKITV